MPAENSNIGKCETLYGTAALFGGLMTGLVQDHAFTGYLTRFVASGCCAHHSLHVTS